MQHTLSPSYNKTTPTVFADLQRTLTLTSKSYHTDRASQTTLVMEAWEAGIKTSLSNRFQLASCKAFLMPCACPRNGLGRTLASRSSQHHRCSFVVSSRGSATVLAPASSMRTTASHLTLLCLHKRSQPQGFVMTCGQVRVLGMSSAVHSHYLLPLTPYDFRVARSRMQLRTESSVCDVVWLWLN